MTHQRSKTNQNTIEKSSPTCENDIVRKIKSVEDVEKELVDTWKNVNQYSHYGNEHGDFFKSS